MKPFNQFALPEPSQDHETLNGQLEADCFANWMSIPPEMRRKVVDHVRVKVPVAMMNDWKRQYSKNIRIGSDDPLFHMYPGMQIRNTCRDILQDKDLPPVTYHDGVDYYNWDDFYTGMLQQLMSEENE